MLPQLADINIGEDLEEYEEPTLTFGIDLENNKVSGLIDEYQAAKQSLFLMLNTEKEEYDIFDYEYGLKTKDLIGKPRSYVYSELRSRITECVLSDERFTKVSDFNFGSAGRDKITVDFKVDTIYGRDISQSISIGGDT